MKWELYNTSNSCVVYRKGGEEFYNTAFFDLENKTLHVTETRFERNNVPCYVPQTDASYHSARYGTWYTGPAYLCLEDLRELSKLAKQFLKRSDTDV